MCSYASTHLLDSLSTILAWLHALVQYSLTSYQDSTGCMGTILFQGRSRQNVFREQNFQGEMMRGTNFSLCPRLPWLVPQTMRSHTGARSDRNGTAFDFPRAIKGHWPAVSSHFSFTSPTARTMATREETEKRKLAATSPKSVVPPGAIPRGVNFILGGMAG